MQYTASCSDRYVPYTSYAWPPKRHRYTEPPRKLLPVTVTLVPPSVGPRLKCRLETTGSA